MKVLTRRSRNDSLSDHNSIESLCPCNIPLTWDLPRAKSLPASVKPKSPGDNPILSARHNIRPGNTSAQALDGGFQQDPTRSAYEFSRQYDDTYSIFITAIEEESSSRPYPGSTISPGTRFHSILPQYGRLMPSSLKNYG